MRLRFRPVCPWLQSGGLDNQIGRVATHVFIHKARRRLDGLAGHGGIAELHGTTGIDARGAIPVSIFRAPAKPEVIEQYARAGVERAIFNLPAAPAGDVLPLLKSQAEIARRFQ